MLQPFAECRWRVLVSRIVRSIWLLLEPIESLRFQTIYAGVATQRQNRLRHLRSWTIFLLIGREFWRELQWEILLAFYRLLLGNFEFPWQLASRGTTRSSIWTGPRQQSEYLQPRSYKCWEFEMVGRFGRRSTKPAFDKYRRVYREPQKVQD